MGYGMMNHNMDLFRVKFALNEMEMKVKLAGRKKKSAKKEERPSWKEVIKKTYVKDPLEEILEEDASEESEAAAVQEQAEEAENGNMVPAQNTELIFGQAIGENPTKAGMSQEKLREAVFWAEILGEPVSRKRQEDRRRRLRESDRRKG